MIKKWKAVFDLGSLNENRKDMELRKGIIILIISKRKTHLFYLLKIAGRYVSFMLMWHVDGDT